MPTVDPKFLEGLRYRCIGPTRGGRVVAVAADPKRQNVFYFGGVAGGVWRTDDCGQYWECITDGFLTAGSIGALAVAPSDGNVIWAGTGESTIRIDVSHGDGVYRSTDAGRTWQHMGLENTRHIGEIVIHPDDPDTVWVAALGHSAKGNPERGVYHTTDGGETWELVLHVSEGGRCRRPLDRSPQSPHSLCHHLAGPSHLLVDRFGRPRLRALALQGRRPHVGGHQPQRGHARRHTRQDGCQRLGGTRRPGLGDGRGRRAQAGPVSVGGPRRHVDQDLVEARTRLAALVLRTRLRASDRPRHRLRVEHEGMEVGRRRRHLHRVPHAARRQPRSLDRPQQPPTA